MFENSLKTWDPEILKQINKETRKYSKNILKIFEEDLESSGTHKTIRHRKDIYLITTRVQITVSASTSLDKGCMSLI